MAQQQNVTSDPGTDTQQPTTKALALWLLDGAGIAGFPALSVGDVIIAQGRQQWANTVLSLQPRQLMQLAPQLLTQIDHAYTAGAVTDMQRQGDTQAGKQAPSI